MTSFSELEQQKMEIINAVIKSLEGQAKALFALRVGAPGQYLQKGREFKLLVAGILARTDQQISQGCSPAITELIEQQRALLKNALRIEFDEHTLVRELEKVRATGNEIALVLGAESRIRRKKAA